METGSHQTALSASLKPPGVDSMNRYLLRASIAAVSTALIASPALAQSSDHPVEEGAGIIAWILVGLIGGFLASKVVDKTGEGMLRDTLLGDRSGVSWAGAVRIRSLIPVPLSDDQKK